MGFYFTQDQALIFNASPLCDPKLGILVLSLTCAGVHAKKLQVCLTVCDPKGCSPQGSSVHGVFQARILEWVAMPSSGDLLDPWIELASLVSPALAGGFFTTSAAWEAHL